jgi:hypothetical protein
MQILTQKIEAVALVLSTKYKIYRYK